VLSAFFLAFVPYNIYYGRTILPDVPAVATSLASLYFFERYLFTKKQSIFALMLSTFFLAIALLLKPYILFFLLPFAALAYKKYGTKMFSDWKLYIFAVVSVLPLIFWRQWIQQFPEGIPVSDWLFNGNGIRFKPAFFRWIGYERITKLISGYVGVVLLAAGVGATLKFALKDKLFIWSFAVSSLVYVCTLATGNVQHDYYQIYILPTLALFYALGAEYLYVLLSKKMTSLVGIGVVGVITLGMFVFAGNQIKDYFNINNRNIVVAGAAVDSLLPKDAKVIAPYEGDTSFLYQTNRSGWPSIEHDLKDMVKLGATHMVLVNPTKNDFTGFGKEYPVVASSSAYLIVRLQ
jgi:4-amino-4-deoxy-L-arabinose transferase-like glycosyltransferase